MSTKYTRGLFSRMRKLDLAKNACLVLFIWVAIENASIAQSFTTLHSFDGTDGDYLQRNGTLVQGTNGNLYGTTFGGGSNSNCSGGAVVGCGTVFEITPQGMLSTLYNFCSKANCTDGGMPWAGLALGSDGNFYGTTSLGGAYGDCSSQEPVGCGTVFKITPAGKLTTLHNFCSVANCADGAYPLEELIQGSDGNFYGATDAGGANGSGTIFKITPEGKLTTLYSYCQEAKCTDGGDPSMLIEATNGNFYGTTMYGGSSQEEYGTIFEVTPAGTLTTLYSFCSQNGSCTDGRYPAGLVQASDGDFYGTTAGGSAAGGTIFKLTTGGKLTTLQSFCIPSHCNAAGLAKGSYPVGPLVQATDGNFYGVTEGVDSESNCSDFECGTVFEMTLDGKVTPLYSFCSQNDCNDGASPVTGLMQATNGRFYGMTSAGGGSSNCSDGCGTVFSLSTGLPPFVQTVPTSGSVGSTITILGNNLKGSTGVSFNGTAASFAILSATQIKATVPEGATTGEVKVVTHAATLTSNAAFQVRP